MKNLLKLASFFIAILTLASCSQSKNLSSSNHSSSPYHKVYYKNRVVYNQVKTNADITLDLGSKSISDWKKEECPELIEPLPPVKKHQSVSNTITASKENLLFRPKTFNPAFSFKKDTSKDHSKSTSKTTDYETAGLLGFIFGLLAFITLFTNIAALAIFGLLLAIAGIVLSSIGLKANGNRVFAILGLIFSILYFVILLIALVVVASFLAAGA